MIIIVIIMIKFPLPKKKSWLKIRPVSEEHLTGWVDTTKSGKVTKAEKTWLKVF